MEVFRMKNNPFSITPEKNYLNIRDLICKHRSTVLLSFDRNNEKLIVWVNYVPKLAPRIEAKSEAKPKPVSTSTLYQLKIPDKYISYRVLDDYDLEYEIVRTGEDWISLKSLELGGYRVLSEDEFVATIKGDSFVDLNNLNGLNDSNNSNGLNGKNKRNERNEKEEGVDQENEEQ